MKKTFAASIALLLFTLAACTSNDGARTGGGNTTPATQIAGGSGQNPFAGNGTMSIGGGGNGINGRTIESYAINIEELPEFKQRILPLLRKLSQGKSDVLVAYLLWAVRHKAWLFVPVPLEKLPQEKVQLTFQSEQLARHGENEIFIDQTSYTQASDQDRASLLLHEMVMAARLLMKKPPQDQCEALSKGADIEACHDRKTLKLAQKPKVQPGDNIHSLNGVDHEAVRALTIYLSDEKQDLSAANVYAVRSRLGFVFPWDGLVSRLTLGDFHLVLKRSMLAEDVFTSKEAHCLFRQFDSFNSAQPNARWWDVVMMKSPLPGGKWPSTFTSPYEVDPKLTETITTSRITLPTETADIANDNTIESHGATDPVFGDGAMLDVFEVLPAVSSPGDGAREKIEFFISRESAPRLLGFRVTKVQGLVKNAGGNLLQKWSEIEWVRVKSSAPIDCRLAN